jgi:hypothetical protein
VPPASYTFGLAFGISHRMVIRAALTLVVEQQTESGEALDTLARLVTNAAVFSANFTLSILQVSVGGTVAPCGLWVQSE